jgi:hypothetical protein
MLVLLLLLNSMAAEPAAAPIKLPYDQTCPVLYDNDYANDYVDWYLMALASAGDIRYRGISTSSSIAPYNRHMPGTDCIATRTASCHRRPVDCHILTRWPDAESSSTRLGKIEHQAD